MTALIKTYHDEEHDFGIDYNVVASLTKLSNEDSKALIASMAKSDTGMYAFLLVSIILWNNFYRLWFRINALTLLMAACCLAEGAEIPARLETIFDIMDFDFGGATVEPTGSTNTLDFLGA